MSDAPLDFCGADDCWQSWIVLRHFLPARLRRELCQRVVTELLGPDVALGDLFEELFVGAELWNEHWLLRPRPGQEALSRAVQHWVMGLVWDGDHSLLSALAGDPREEPPMVRCVDALTELGSADFGWPITATASLLQSIADTLQGDAQRLMAAWSRLHEQAQANEPAVDWDAVSESLRGGPLLTGIALKHFGDLFAGCDQWSDARAAYLAATSRLEMWEPAAPDAEIAKAWRSIAERSLEVAGEILGEGPGVTTRLALSEDPLGALNTGLDATNASAGQGAFRDYRVAESSCPLSVAQHRVSNAFEPWMRGKHHDAHRAFWAEIRRATALGSVSDVNRAKAWYASCLFASVESGAEQEQDGNAFETAIRLILESEKPDVAELLEWSPRLLRRVNEEVVGRAKVIAASHRGTLQGRTRVLIVLLDAWATHGDPSQISLLAEIGEQLAIVARDWPSTLEAKSDLGRPALKAMASIATRQPTAGASFAHVVEEAVMAQLDGEFLWGRVAGAEAATAFGELFEESAVRRIRDHVLCLLEGLPKPYAFWPLSDAFCRLLIERPFRMSCDADTANRVVTVMLALRREAEVVPERLLFFLADFDQAVLQREPVKEALGPVIEALQQGAGKLNSSNVSSQVLALLLAPSLSGEAGTHQALQAIVAILASVGDGQHPSLGVTTVYKPLLEFCRRLPELRERWPTAQWLADDLSRIGDELGRFWATASAKPIVLAGWGFPPPVRPEDVVVHNCAYATLQFGIATGGAPRMIDSLETARSEASLRTGITRAFATLATNTDQPEVRIAFDGIEEDGRDMFYGALGGRLAALESLPADEKHQACARLLSRCLELGPSPGDAAVFVAGVSAPSLEVDVRVLDVYQQRLSGEAELQSLIAPLAAAFRRALQKKQ